jgi:hypothetical protein
MNRPDPPVARPQAPAPIGSWRRRLLYAGCLALIATGVLAGLLGSIKLQAVTFPLNVEMREGCLADPSLVDPRAPCPHEAEAVLRYPDGRTEVIRGTPKEVKRRVTRATEPVVAAERRSGLVYLVVATLLLGGGIAAIARDLRRRGPRPSRHPDRTSGDGLSSRAG